MKRQPAGIGQSYYPRRLKPEKSRVGGRACRKSAKCPTARSPCCSELRIPKLIETNSSGWGQCRLHRIDLVADGRTEAHRGRAEDVSASRTWLTWMYTLPVSNTPPEDVLRESAPRAGSKHAA